jgi:glycosyltransferase involved in cell wall biosynthesis
MGLNTVMFHPLRAYRRQLAPNGEIILVCVCRLGLEKGFDFLARVAVQLVAAALPFKLLIVGGNSEPQSRRGGRPGAAVRAREGPRCLHWILDRANRWRGRGSVSALFHYRNLRARRAGGHGQRGAGDRPRSRRSIGHLKTGYLEDRPAHPAGVERPGPARAALHRRPPTCRRDHRRVAGQLADALSGGDSHGIYYIEYYSRHRLAADLVLRSRTMGEQSSCDCTRPWG